MSINVDLSGAELATYLANALSDLEFELLVRKRITIEFDRLHASESNLDDSRNSCQFQMSWGDEPQWMVRIGENYNKSASNEGQVLSRCCADVMRMYDMKNGNKLSLLLPAPAPENDTKKW
jgi:hypothetical protein